MQLKHYWASGGIVDFDPGSGAVRRSKQSEASHWGFAWKQRRRWFVIWLGEESLVLQHRAEQWSLTPEVELEVSGQFRRSFRITRKGQSEFRLRYWFKGTVFAHIDPTYDAIDEESDDFFIYVTSMWSHWKDRNIEEFAELTRVSERNR